MAEDKTDSGSNPPRKYSRYRSVRQQADAARPEPSSVAAQQDSHDVSVTRSMSRYRRSRIVPKTSHPMIPPVPPVPIPQSPPESSMSGAGGMVRRVTEPAAYTPPKQQLPARHETVPGSRGQRRVQETEADRVQRKAEEMREHERQHQRGEQEQDESESFNATSGLESLRLAEEERERLLAEQKRKDLERLEAELDAAMQVVPRVTSPGRDRFNFFSRKRAATRAIPSTTDGSGKGSMSMSRTRSNGSPPRAVTEPHPRGIEQGGRGIVPGTDAPISAVNAGERRVLIRCKQSSINLPITPETTPRDLVYSAANIMNQSITPSTAILLESYTRLGLERRIRRYEHIRDIMNSWDRDTQNALILQNTDSPNYDHDLEPHSVSREPPKDVSVYMYHSQKPGKWNKRHITLLSSGQMFMSKKPGSRPSDKDVLNLCHLSDFDIYTPTSQQLRKNLRPPKKYCYAVKSQQKTTMFLSTENFVHFFSTDDEALAEKWHTAVQRWRSWYLVNRMGEGNRGTKAAKELPMKAHIRPETKAGPTHKVRVSLDEDPYTIGSFKPLIDIDRFEAHSEPEYDSDDENRPRQIPFHLRNGVCVPAMTSHQQSKRHPPPVAYKLPPEVEEEFASSGLLGELYSQRQKTQREREAASKRMSNPFVGGPSLINGSDHQRPQTSTGPESAKSIQRNGSKREKPKPLLDFTPQFKEAPQWDKTGKGHGVPAPSGIPLVEVATTPESALVDLPQTTVFRRDSRPVTSAGPVKHAEGGFVKGGLVSGTAGRASLLNRGRVNT